MTTYITPTVYRYENVDKLLKSNPSSTSLEQLQLSIDDLLEKRFCVLSENRELVKVDCSKNSYLQ